MLSFVALVCLASGFAQVNSQWGGGWGANLQNEKYQEMLQQWQEMQQNLPPPPSGRLEDIIQRYQTGPKSADETLVPAVQEEDTQKNIETPEVEQLSPQAQAEKNREQWLQNLRQRYGTAPQPKNRIPNFGRYASLSRSRQTPPPQSEPAQPADETLVRAI